MATIWKKLLQSGLVDSTDLASEGGVGTVLTTNGAGALSFTSKTVNSNTVDMGDGFKVRDDDSDVTVTENQYVKFASATGTNGVQTTGTGTTSDPYIVTITSADTTVANTNQLTTFDVRDDDDDDVNISHGEFLQFISATGTAGTDLSGSGGDGDPFVMTITSPDTNTHRAIDDTPVNGVTDESISSNWAYDHKEKTGNGGHIPSAGSGNSLKFLRNDGTWQLPNYTTNTNTVDMGSGFTVSATTDSTAIVITENEDLLFTAGAGITCETTGAQEVTITSTITQTTNTDVNVNLTNLKARLPEIDASLTIGDDTDVDITFAGDVVVTGDLRVSGAQITTATELLSVADNTILLNSDKTGTADIDAGIVIERGTTGDYVNNKSLYWDEGDDKWKFSTGTTTTIGGTYNGDVMALDKNSSYADDSVVVPIGHLQFDGTDLYVRIS